MEALFIHAGVFALVTLAVAMVCQWFVRQEEKREPRAVRTPEPQPEEPSR